MSNSTENKEVIVNETNGIVTFQRLNMFGRTVIYSSVDEVTSDNLIPILQKVWDKHRKNSEECDYLWEYYNGNQPILARTKKQRKDICNRIVENRANELVNFKVGYYAGEPIIYTSKNDTEEYLRAMEELNAYMYGLSKEAQDHDLVEWQMVAGTAYRIVLPTEKNSPYREYRPFEMETLDPRTTFVVYSTKIGHKKLMAGTYYKDDNNRRHFTIYTDKYCYKFEEYMLREGTVTPHSMGMIPIFEYPANNSRLGCFEPVLPLLDELNNVASNRMDGIEQTIQSFIKFINCNIDEEKYEKFLEKCAIVVNSTDGGQADVDVVTTDLDQDKTQTMKKDIYDSILDIVGVPSRTANASGDSTGSAIILRNGWETAEARAKSFELMFKRSEREMLALVLKICRENGTMPLLPWEIEPHFTRRNYEAIGAKATVLTMMLDNPKIHPILAYEHCGMFTDPESAWLLSEKYYNEIQAKYEEPTEVNEVTENEELVRANGQIANTVEEENIP